MQRAILAFTALPLLALAQKPVVSSVVNAASYQPVDATAPAPLRMGLQPSSIGTIFGTNLAASTVSATNTPAAAHPRANLHDPTRCLYAPAGPGPQIPIPRLLPTGARAEELPHLAGPAGNNQKCCCFHSGPKICYMGIRGRAGSGSPRHVTCELRRRKRWWESQYSQHPRADVRCST
jgi:hypothetical protein